MTNDLTTLSGALLEMKDQLIYELGQKGVTASYDSTTGLLGLIGQISNIQTGSSCYHIEFDSSSYTAINGSVTVSATLQQNYSTVSGETVTFSASGISQTATTDSNGVATTTIIGLTSDITLTASYDNVSDTATVTVQSVTVYYESALTSDDGNWQKSSSSGMNITYDATNGCTVTGTTTNDRTYYINTSSVTIPTSDIVVEYDIVNYALGAYSNSTEFVIFNSKIVFNDTDLNLLAMSGSGNYTKSLSSLTFPVHIRVEVTSSTISTYVDGTLLGTTNYSGSYKNIGFKTYNNRSMTIKNIKVYELM